MIKWKITSKDKIRVVSHKFCAISLWLTKEGHQTGNLCINQNWSKELCYTSEPKKPTEESRSIDTMEMITFKYMKKEYVEYSVKNVDTVIVQPFRIGNKTVLFGIEKIGMRWEGHGEYSVDTDYDRADAKALYLRMLYILRTVGGSFDIAIEDKSGWSVEKSTEALENFIDKEKADADNVSMALSNALSGKEEQDVKDSEVRE